MAEAEWWYADGGDRVGPVSLDALRQLLRESKISQSTLIWTEGFPNWTPISTVPELSSGVTAGPPVMHGSISRNSLIALPLAGHWRRFFARLIDLWVIAVLASVPLGVFLGSVSPSFVFWIQKPGSEYMYNWLVLPLVMFIEAAIYAMFGTTLGKALLRVKVVTVGAQPLTAGQYLQRQLSVYWYGMGTGFPLVSLFTFLRQYGHLKAGRQTGYDQGKFNVKADTLGIWRGLLAALVLAVIFSVNAVLGAMSKSSDRAYNVGSSWVNEVTGNTVSVPAGWIYEKDKNDDKQTVHIFSGIDHGVSIVFAKEDAPPSMGLGRYTELWLQAVRSEMTFREPGESIYVGNRQAIVFSGHMRNDRSRRVQATLVKRGSQIWRTVVVGNPGKRPDSQPIMKLQSLLFQSIV